MKLRIAYPHERRPWAAVFDDGSSGTYDPVTGQCRRKLPQHDSALPGLRKWLGRGRLVAYRPGRRATLATVDGEFHLKIVRPGRAAKLAERHTLFGRVAQDAGFEVPRLVWSDVSSGVLAFRTIAGDRLDPLTCSSDAIGEIARLVRGLSLRDDIRLPGRAPDRLDWWIDLVHAHDPQPDDRLLEAIAAVRARLREQHRLIGFSPERSGAVHGDLHDGNLLLSPSGRVVLLDLDTAGRGDPVADAASFLAHVELRAVHSRQARRIDLLEDFLAGYHPSGPDIERLRQQISLELLRLACLYRFRLRLAHFTDLILDRSVAWAEWETL